ncbi:hypothetical protein AAHE18_13G170400 [Arachis hypogaea]
MSPMDSSYYPNHSSPLIPYLYLPDPTNIPHAHHHWTHHPTHISPLLLQHLHILHFTTATPPLFPHLTTIPTLIMIFHHCHLTSTTTTTTINKEREHRSRQQGGRQWKWQSKGEWRREVM